jgi:hypothetical protein
MEIAEKITTYRESKRSASAIWDWVKPRALAGFIFPTEAW